MTRWLRLMFVREAGDDLYLGQAIPRYWLRDGSEIGIQTPPPILARCRFPTSRRSQREGKIVVKLDPPKRNPPRTIYLRLRHPDAKPIKSVVVNGKPFDKIDVQKEWIVLPGDLKSPQTIVVSY